MTHNDNEEFKKKINKRLKSSFPVTSELQNNYLIDSGYLTPLSALFLAARLFYQRKQECLHVEDHNRSKEN